MSEEEWKKKLTPEQYRILREKGTEAPFTGELLFKKDKGTYNCAACGAILFKSEDKYDSTTPGLWGWPSFADVAKSGVVALVKDSSYGLQRVEVQCASCGGHLGHLFDDESAPTGQHYCVSSVSLNFKKPQSNKQMN